MSRKFCMVMLMITMMMAPSLSYAAGGSGGGGGGGGGGNIASGGNTAQLTGLCTAIDYNNYTMIVGQLYYGNGAFTVSRSVKVSVNSGNATFEDVKVGDLCEVKYDSKRVIVKIAITRAVTP